MPFHRKRCLTTPRSVKGNESGLLAYYRFDEGFGKVTADHRYMAKSRIRHDADLNGFFPLYALSYAPFETCNLRCSDHGMCLVVESQNGFDQHVCKCEQGYDGKDCENQVCPGAPLPCSYPNGYCKEQLWRILHIGRRRIFLLVLLKRQI